MIRKALIVTLSIIFLSFGADKPITADCKCKDIPLYGRVEIVDHHPDFKVRIVDAFEDLRVRWVDFTPKECGQWQKVDHHPDFRVQFVDHHPDFRIRIVEFKPGIPY